ncbi:MAG: lipopolysaccharide biosynthesis protein [Gemmatimonadetes bacterium]|nr:lipopolysaccharide biosynthesis protein [Gemmatimonadota bacterium]
MTSSSAPETAVPHGGAARDIGPSLTASEVLHILLRDLRLLVWLPLFLLAAAVVVMKARAPRYQSESRMHPRSGDGGMGRFAGIAAQFGVALPGGGNGAPLKLYAEMLTGQKLMRDALATTFTIPAGAGSRDSVQHTLLELLTVPGADPLTRIQTGVARLRGAIDLLPNEATSTIRLRITLRWPGVSEKLNRRLLELVNASALELRRAQATSEKQFVEARLATAQEDLDRAEIAIQHFFEVNRSYEGSPQLRSELDRLRRRVDLRQQVFVALAQGLEQARIDEMRNTPVLEIIDPPELSAMRVGRVRDTLIFLPIGFVIAVTISIGRALVRRHASENPASTGLLRRQLVAGLRRAFFLRNRTSASAA